LYRGESDIDFIGKRRIWFALSGLLLALSAGALIFKGLNYGIEFRGGIQIQSPVPANGPLKDAPDSEVVTSVREALAPFGASDAQIQVATDDSGRSVLVQTKRITDERERTRVVDAVARTVGAAPQDTAFEAIGSKWGAEITEKAIRALVVFMVVVIAFISWRFEWKMALAAVAALFHDLLITAGIYSLVGFEVTPSTIIAILTIMGYSLYDTVVVFDKVEENTVALASTGKMTYQGAANLAMNQVFMRSLNTSLTTLIPVGALLFVGAGLLGASTLKDLALALLVGILAGTYSSIFFATPILALLKEREPRYRNVRERVLREARRRPETVAAAPEEEPLERVPAAVAVRPVKTTRPPARPRPGSKKAKRRKRR
jgi:preprotein translocase subunit SecF